MVAGRSVATRPHRNSGDGATKFDETHPQLSPLVTLGRRAERHSGDNFGPLDESENGAFDGEWCNIVTRASGRN